MDKTIHPSTYVMLRLKLWVQKTIASENTVLPSAGIAVYWYSLTAKKTQLQQGLGLSVFGFLKKTLVLWEGKAWHPWNVRRLREKSAKKCVKNRTTKLIKERKSLRKDTIQENKVFQKFGENLQKSLCICEVCSPKDCVSQGPAVV